jgi:hypothetical protein
MVFDGQFHTITIPIADLVNAGNASGGSSSGQATDLTQMFVMFNAAMVSTQIGTQTNQNYWTSNIYWTSN